MLQYAAGILITTDISVLHCGGCKVREMQQATNEWILPLMPSCARRKCEC